jgi:uncharacterized protein
MASRPLTLELLPDVFAICRLGADAPLPAWAARGPLLSITRTYEELSIVCIEQGVPEGVQKEGNWKCFRVAGTLAFSQVGILASLVTPLAEAGISAFAVSTFDTDYMLVRVEMLDTAATALGRAGHDVRF